MRLLEENISASGHWNGHGIFFGLNPKSTGNKNKYK
jgi:hypothetical protein